MCYSYFISLVVVMCMISICKKDSLEIVMDFFGTSFSREAQKKFQVITWWALRLSDVLHENFLV